tara:strand:- start:23 stop:181 length:159 start_codon:yes stop_codon:yes gene_type:complete
MTTRYNGILTLHGKGYRLMLTLEKLIAENHINEIAIANKKSNRRRIIQRTLD